MNRGLFIQNIRGLSWIGILYTILMFFYLPIHIIMQQNNPYVPHWTSDNELDRIFPEYHWMTMWVIPIILAVFLFRYLNIKKSTEYIHSLPIKRVALFHQQLLFGILTLVIPVLLTTIFVCVLKMTMTNTPSYTVLFTWAGTTIFLTIFFFFVAVFVGIFTGMSLMHGALSYLIFVLPSGVFALIILSLQKSIFGLTANMYVNHLMGDEIPLIRTISLNRELLSTKEYLMYGLFLIGCYIFALIAYKKRPIESATQAIAFPVFRPIFKYGMTFCAMLTGGVYFGNSSNNSSWTITGYVFGAIIGYIVAEMILEKTFRIFGNWKGIVIFTAVMIVISLLFPFITNNYENKVPELADIKQVYVGYSYHEVKEFLKTADRNIAYKELSSRSENITPSTMFIRETNNIEAVRQLHQAIIQTKKQSVQESNRNLFIMYDLKNGKKLSRQYTLPTKLVRSVRNGDRLYVISDELTKKLTPLYDSLEYKTLNNAVLRIKDITKIDKIRFEFAEPETEYEGSTIKYFDIVNHKEIVEVISILQEEIKKSSFKNEENIVQNEENINMLMKHGDGTIYASISGSYTTLKQWITNHHYKYK